MFVDQLGVQKINQKITSYSMKTILPLVFLLSFFMRADAVEPTMPRHGGWTAESIDSAVDGCTAALIAPQRKGYMDRGTSLGNLNSAKEWGVIEPIFRNEFKNTCTCVIDEVSLKYDFEKFVSDAKTVMSSLPDLIQRPGAKCFLDENKLKKIFLDHREEINAKIQGLRMQ